MELPNSTINLLLEATASVRPIDKTALHPEKYLILPADLKTLTEEMGNIPGVISFSPYICSISWKCDTLFNLSHKIY